jgi:hypothetical protein
MAYYEVHIKYKGELVEKIEAEDEKSARECLLWQYCIDPEDVISTKVEEIEKEAYLDPEY